MKTAVEVIVKLSLVLALGVVILIAQLDRASVSAPGLIGSVPNGLGGNADAIRAATLTQTNPKQALGLARTVVLARPFPAKHLSLLAQAAIETNNVDLSSAALTIAATRGWRDAYTQTTVFGTALQNGSYDIALQRLEALAKGQNQREPMILATNYLITEQRGRDALARQLANSPDFSDNLLAAARTRLDLAAFYADTIFEAQRLGARFDCILLSEYTYRLLSEGSTAEAATIWPGNCDGAAYNDFSFDLGGSSDPYGWQFESKGSLILRSGSERGTLDVENRDPFLRKIGHKFSRIRPGLHNLSIDYLKRAGLDQPIEAEIVPSLYCGSWVDKKPLLLRETTKGTYEFDVPPQCSTQLLSLAMRQGSRQGVSVTIQ